MGSASLLSFVSLELIFNFGLISKAKLMFWGVILCFMNLISFWCMKNPDMAFRPGILILFDFWLHFSILGREDAEIKGLCPGVHKIKEINRWNILIFITGFIFLMSLGLRSLISHEDKDEKPKEKNVIYAELFTAFGEILGSYVFGYFYHKRGIRSIS